MAQGGGVSESKAPCLYEEFSFITFLKSATWLYPISRFLGHAIQYYRYEIDFFSQDESHDGQVEERNWIIYENYYDLIGCLLSKYCREYDIKPSKVVTEILAAAANAQPGSEAMIVRSFNFIRATYGVLHFGYLIMNYCNLFKMKCLEDLIEETKQMRLDDSEKEHWQELWKYTHGEMITITKKQKFLEKCFSHNATEMLKEMQYGPYICTCGIKLCDLGYHSDLTLLLDNMNNLKKTKALINKGISEEEEKLVTEDVMRDDLATLLRTTQLRKKSTPPPPSLAGELHELNKLKAEGLEMLKQTLSESPVSAALVTMSERLAVITSSDKEPRYYTAPSSPVQLETQESEKSAKSKQKPSTSNKPPEPHHDIAPSSPVKTKPIQTAEESVTKPGKKKGSDSPNNQYATAPSSPTVIKSKALSESPQGLVDVPANLQMERFPSPKLVAASSLEDLTVPDNESDRKEFLLCAYDRRVVKQLAYMAAVLEIQITIGTKEGLKELIYQQRWFEKKWPSPHSKAKPGDKAKDDTTIEKRELKMLDEVFHGQAFLEVLWRLYDAKIKKN